MPDPNPSERLAEIEARVEAATPEPWKVGLRKINAADVRRIVQTQDDVPIAEIEKWDEVADQADAELIAHARSDIPWLLELVKKLREAVDAGRRFERVYQESLGATPTAAQYELLDSLQSRFIDLYAQALADSGEASGEAST